MPLGQECSPAQRILSRDLPPGWNRLMSVLGGRTPCRGCSGHGRRDLMAGWDGMHRGSKGTSSLCCCCCAALWDWHLLVPASVRDAQRQQEKNSAENEKMFKFSLGKAFPNSPLQHLSTAGIPCQQSAVGPTWAGCPARFPGILLPKEAACP